MQYNSNWQKNKTKCYFCGTNMSVKYIVTLKDDIEERRVFCCNKCVFLNEIK